jgi:DNA-directed RNA polymerase alpha subunit
MSELDALPISNPARRALAAARLARLEDLTRVSEKELMRLHGMGPKAFNVILDAMQEKQLAFASEEGSITVSEEANQKLSRCRP